MIDMKRVYILLLTTLLLLTFNSSTVEAKATTKLSNSNVTLNVGKKKTIQLKNYDKKKIKKAKWSTSNKKVVSIKASKQKCTITAKKAGKATIKVKYNGKTYKCKVTVKKTTKKKTTEKTTTEKTTTETTTEKSTTETTTEKTTESPTTEKPTETPTVPNETPTTPSVPTAHDCWFSAVDTHYDAENVGEYGYTVWTCSMCGKELTTIKDTEPKQRAYTEEWITVDPTCTQDGYKVKIRTYTDNNETEEVPNTKSTLTKLDHSWTYDYSEHHCPHVEVTRTSTCSRCGEIYKDTGKTYNQIKSDRYNGGYTVYIDLNPNKYDDEQWQNTYGTYGACVIEVKCNHCSYISSRIVYYTLSDIYSQVKDYKENKGYNIILRSNNFTNPTSGETSVINDIKDLCK